MKRVSDVDLRLLKIFATVAEFKGFAAAQTELNLSAPSISNYITALEQRLGVKLCTRGRAGFALTDKGAVIYREAQKLFAATDEFTANAGAVTGRLTGTLRLGLVDCMVTDSNSPVADALRRFSKRDHDVRIEISIGAPASLQRGVLEKRLHLAVACFPSEISALPSEPLYDEINSFYCGIGHPLFDRAEVDMNDIRSGRVIARSYWRHADLARLGIDREAASVDFMEAQATLILSGAYLGYLPEHYAAAWVKEGKMRRLLPERLSYLSPFSMIVRRGSADVQVVRQFIGDLRDAARAINAPMIDAPLSRPRRRAAVGAR